MVISFSFHGMKQLEFNVITAESSPLRRSCSWEIYLQHFKPKANIFKKLSPPQESIVNFANENPMMWQQDTFLCHL